MKLIDRYIFKEFLAPFRYCFLSFVLIFIIGDLFENLDAFILQKVPWLLVWKYYLFLIPTVFVLVTPLTVLLSILYQLGYMSRHNEIVALKASGISFWRIVVPFGIVGIIFSILLFIVNERLVPRTIKELDYIRERYISPVPMSHRDGGKKEDVSNTIKYEKITFFSSLYNLSFYVDRVSQDTLEGVSIREFYKDGSLKKEWYAKKAIWIDSSWWLFDGYIRRCSVPWEGSEGMYFFIKQEVPVNIPPEDLIRSQKDITVISNYMDVNELYNYIRRNFSPGTIPRELLVELYRKLSIPFAIIIVTILGVTFGGRISRGGALASVGFSMAFYLAYYGVSSFLIAMGKVGRLMPGLAVWTPHILFGIISGYLLRKTR